MKLFTCGEKYCGMHVSLCLALRHLCCNIFLHARIISLSHSQSLDNPIFYYFSIFSLLWTGETFLIFFFIQAERKLLKVIDSVKNIAQQLILQQSLSLNRQLPTINKNISFQSCDNLSLIHI